MLDAVKTSVCPVVYSFLVSLARMEGGNYRAREATIAYSMANEPLLDHVWHCEGIVADAQPSGYDVSIGGVLRKTWLSASF